MKLRYILFSSIIFSIVLMVGCLQQEQKKETHNDSTITNKSTSEVPEPISVGETKAKIDCLEKLFSNDNFYLINNTDTNFYYFTRLNDFSIFTHSYKMLKGDSTHLKIDTIQVNNQNQIIWNWQQQHLILDSVTNKTARWINKENLNKIVFNKNAQVELMYTDKFGRTFKMTKTPQISLFLSRSFFDNKNGTQFAFDTTNFTKK